MLVITVNHFDDVIVILNVCFLLLLIRSDFLNLKNGACQVNGVDFQLDCLAVSVLLIVSHRLHDSYQKKFCSTIHIKTSLRKVFSYLEHPR